jgi:hypothetical protein
VTLTERFVASAAAGERDGYPRIVVAAGAEDLYAVGRGIVRACLFGLDGGDEDPLDLEFGLGTQHVADRGAARQQ